MKKFLKWVGIVFIGFIALGIIGSIFSDSPATSTAEAEATTSSEKAVTEVKSNWKYSENVDKMTEQNIKFAQVGSTNELKFEFPYNGGTSFSLIARKRDNENDLVLSIDKERGQFIPSFANERSVLIRFDGSKAQSFSYSMPTDGSTHTIFIDKADAIINRLKTTKQLMVQADFYNEGRQIVEFDVEGFKWD